jgi:hypothetical protein
MVDPDPDPELAPSVAARQVAGRSSQQGECPDGDHAPLEASAQGQDGVEAREEEAQEEHMLHDTWTLYFHEPSDTDWTMASYVRLEQLSSVESFWQVHEAVKKYLNRGMFFLMREHVFPCWDDPSNVEGGCISIKVLKDDLEAFWEEAVTRMLGESLIRPPRAGDADDDDSWAIVNGVSTSPKRYFCICKIWLKDGTKTDKKNFFLPGKFHGEPLYRSNAENIRQNNERTVGGGGL